MRSKRRQRAYARVGSLAFVSVLTGVLGVALASPASASVASFCTGVGASQVGATNDCLVAFTTTGTTTWTMPTGITSIQYLVVGGGGAGRNGYPSNGAIAPGGAGGSVQQNSSATVSSGATLTVVVGVGGASSAGAGGSSGLQGGGLSVTASGGSGGSISGAGSNGTTSSITGSSLVFGSSGGATGASGGSGAGSGAANNSWAWGGSGTANQGGGGGAGAPADTGFGWSATGGGTGGSGVVYIRFTAAVAPSVLVSAAPTGTTVVGSTLTSATTYNGVPTPSMSYQWQSSSDGSNWTNIDGATGLTYASTAVDAGAYLRVRTTATNDYGSASNTSPSAGPMAVPTPGVPAVAAASDTGSSSADGITSVSTPLLQASGLVTGATVTLTATSGGVSHTCTFVATGPTGSCTMPALSDGVWAVTAKQVLNGVDSASTSATSITIDTAVPGIPAYAFSSGGSGLSSGGVTSNNSISFSSGPTSSGSTSISCALDGGAVQTPCPASFGPLSSGSHSISIVSQDAAGNQSTSTFPFSYLGQPTQQLASASDTGASSSDGVTTDSTPQIMIGGLVVGSTVTVSGTDGSTTRTCSFVATSSTGNCDLPVLSDGSWTVTSTQSLGGTFSTASAPTSVIVDTTAPSSVGSPAVVPTGGTPVNNQISASTTGVTISAPITAGQATGGSAKFWLNGELIGTDSSIGAGDTSVSINFGSSAAIQAAIAAGGNVTVELLDAAGNSVTSTATALTVDYIVPTATITPANGQSTNTATSPLHFTLSMSEAISGLSASDVTNAGTATGCVFTPSATSGTTFDIVVTGCSAGTVQPRLSASSVTDGINPGPTSGTSSASAVNFVTMPPSGTGAPTISALSPGTTTTLGSTLSATAGTWNDQGDSAATTTYQWQVCTLALASSCTDIVGQSGQTFVPNGTYDGAYIRAVTTRTNAAGTSSAQESSLVGPMTRTAQVVSFTGPINQTFSTTPIALVASSNRGLTVMFTSMTPTICSVGGSAVTMLGAGMCTIQADQPGDSMYLAASAVTQSFTISRAAQTIAITTPTQAVAVGSTITLASSAPGTGAISYTVTSGGTYCSVVGNVLTSLGTGDCTVTSTIAQDAGYLTATSSSVTYSARISRTSTLDVPSGALLSDGTALVSASLSTGGVPGIYAGPPEVCRASGLTIILVGQGDCFVSTMSSADGTYMAAEPQSKVFKVGGLPAAPTINGVTLNGTTASVDFTPGGNGGATSITDYTITATPVGGGTPITVRCTTSPCSVPGLSPGKAYDFTASANGLVGGKSVSSTPATYGPVKVAAPSTITILPPSKSDTGSGSFVLNASSSLGGALPLSYTSLTPSVCTVSSTGQVTVVGPGTCSITAGHAGGMVNGVLYSPASQTISIEIPKKPGVFPNSPNVRPSGGGAGGASDNGQSQGSGRPSITPFSSYVEVNGDGSAWANANFKSPLKRPVIVEFVVLDTSGQVVDRIKVKVPAGQDAAKARISPFPPGGSVKVMVASDQEPRIRRAATITHASSSNLASLAEANSLGAAMCAPVRFGPDSSVLSSEAKASLEECARKLDRKGGVSTFAGYVRNGGGNVRDQLTLADQRARAVVDEFLRQGVRVDMRFGGVGAVTKEIGIPAHRRVAIHWSAQSA